MHEPLVDLERGGRPIKGIGFAFHDRRKCFVEHSCISLLCRNRIRTVQFK